MEKLPPACSPSLPVSAPFLPAFPTLAVLRTPSWWSANPPNPSSACWHMPCSTRPSWGEELMLLRCVGLACGGHSKVPPGARLEPAGSCLASRGWWRPGWSILRGSSHAAFLCERSLSQPACGTRNHVGTSCPGSRGGEDSGGNMGVGAKHHPAMGTDHTEEGVFRDKFSGSERAQLVLAGRVTRQACQECVWLLLPLSGKARWWQEDGVGRG